MAEIKVLRDPVETEAHRVWRLDRLIGQEVRVASHSERFDVRGKLVREAHLKYAVYINDPLGNIQVRVHFGTDDVLSITGRKLVSITVHCA